MSKFALILIVALYLIMACATLALDGEGRWLLLATGFGSIFATTMVELVDACARKRPEGDPHA